MSDTSTTYPIYQKDLAEKCFTVQISESIAAFLIIEKDETIINVTSSEKIMQQVKLLYDCQFTATAEEIADKFDMVCEKLFNLFNPEQQ